MVGGPLNIPRGECVPGSVTAAARPAGPITEGMSAVSMTCIPMAEEGFGLPSAAAYPDGAAFAAALFIMCIVKR